MKDVYTKYIVYHCGEQLYLTVRVMCLKHDHSMMEASFSGSASYRTSVSTINPYGVLLNPPFPLLCSAGSRTGLP